MTDDARLERRLREAGLDETIEASFPASDPPSTDPDPIRHDEPLPRETPQPDDGSSPDESG